MKIQLATTVATLCASAALLPAGAAAQSSQGWQFDASLYLYLPSAGGQTRFGDAGSGNEAVVDTAKLLDSLNATFMGSFEARRGVWGGFTDIVYIEFDASKSGNRGLTIGGVPLPADASASTDYNLKGTAWTVAGLYRVVPDRFSPVDVFAGARLLDFKQTFSWQLSGNVGAFPLPGRGGTREATVHNVDAIVGVKGRFALGANKKWFVPYYLDVGTGNSDLTWQVTAGLGYSLPWLDVVGSWRYLDYHMKSGRPFERLYFNGPAVAAVFRW